MPTTKRIICLANSRKLQGRCVAGIELAEQGPAKWIQPVSARKNQEVSEYERQYDDGSDPRLLEILDIPLLKHQPKGFQQENWLLDPERYWRKVGKFDWRRLVAFTETPEPPRTKAMVKKANLDASRVVYDPIEAIGLLWQNGHSSYNGKNDRIPLAEASSETSSLKLIKVDEVELQVSTPGEAFGNLKRSVQGRFLFSQWQYALRVTDPNIERKYLKKPDGTYRLGECYLTISLGEPFKGFVYKLIAAVLEDPR